ncbi:hypothetical protein V8C35DRAFT_282497 [Trichoderma chlorosporum]
MANEILVPPREPSIASQEPKEETMEDFFDAPTAGTTSVSRDPSIVSLFLEMDEEIPTPYELTIASLDLGKDDEDFADGVACVQAYWAHASQMDANMQEQMRELIISKQFALTLSSRQSISKHRLYRGTVGKDDLNTWPIFLILKALYKDLPQSYLRKLRAKGLDVNGLDYTHEYMAAYPNTVQPRIFDTDTTKGREYREMWPRLKNTPTIYRKSRAKSDKQPAKKATETMSKPSASSSTSSPTSTLATSTPATGSVASANPIPQQSQGCDKKRPAPLDSTVEPPAKLPKVEDIEFDKVIAQMTLPGVPSSASNKVDVEKELADVTGKMAKMHQQMQAFMKVTADVVTSMKTEIEDLKEENRSLKK